MSTTVTRFLDFFEGVDEWDDGWMRNTTADHLTDSKVNEILDRTIFTAILSCQSFTGAGRENKRRCNADARWAWLACGLLLLGFASDDTVRRPMLWRTRGILIVRYAPRYAEHRRISKYTFQFYSKERHAHKVNSKEAILQAMMVEWKTPDESVVVEELVGVLIFA